jgi:hypothetical protein
MLWSEDLGLLLQEGREGALEQSGRGRSGDGFHHGQIDIGTWAEVAEGPSGNDFSPLGGEVTDLLESLG